MPRRAKIKTERIVRSLGKDWGKAVQREVTKAARAHALSNLSSGKHVTEDQVEAVVALTVHMVFPRKGKGKMSFYGAGEVVSCCCVMHPGACVCTGPGAANCDCTVALVE